MLLLVVIIITVIIIGVVFDANVLSLGYWDSLLFGIYCWHIIYGAITGKPIFWITGKIEKDAGDAARLGRVLFTVASIPGAIFSIIYWLQSNFEIELF